MFDHTLRAQPVQPASFSEYMFETNFSLLNVFINFLLVGFSTAAFRVGLFVNTNCPQTAWFGMILFEYILFLRKLFLEFNLIVD